MHFILAPVGSDGDVHPFVGLGLAMRARGHRVTFIVNGYFRELIETHGFEQLEFGTADEYLELANDPALWHPRKALGHIFSSFVEPFAPLHLELVREAYEPGAVVLTSCLGVGALMARETDQIPVLTIHLQPSVIWSNEAPPKLPNMYGPRWMLNLQYWLARTTLLPWLAGRPVNRVRARYGLRPVADVMRWWNSPDGVLCLFPEWYCPPATDWPRVMQASFPLWDAGRDQTLSTEVQQFLDAGEPPVVFTPGSANRFGAEFFAEALAATRQIGSRALLLSKFPDQVPPLPDHAAHFAYVPFEQLLPRCAAVVHHGGIGSTAQAIRAGTPQLIMALAHDQFDNGERVQRLSLGRWLPSSKFRATRVAQELSELLGNAAYREHAQAASDRLQGNDLESAVKQLEQHLEAAGNRESQ